MPRAQDVDAMGDSRIRTRRVKAPVASFRWMLRPVTEQIGENEWTVWRCNWKSNAHLPGGDLSEAFGRINRLYNEVIPHMKRLRLTKGGAYTMWLDARNRPAVVWAFRKASMPFSGRYFDPETGRELVSDGVLPLVPGKVYRLLPNQSKHNS